MKLSLTKNMDELFSLLNQAINILNNSGVNDTYKIASVSRWVVWVNDGKTHNDVGVPIAYSQIELIGDAHLLSDYLFTEIG